MKRIARRARHLWCETGFFCARPPESPRIEAADLVYSAQAITGQEGVDAFAELATELAQPSLGGDLLSSSQ